MQFYDITILIFGLSERDGLILDQCAAPLIMMCTEQQKIYITTDFLWNDFLGNSIRALYIPHKTEEKARNVKFVSQAIQRNFQILNARVARAVLPLNVHQFYKPKSSCFYFQCNTFYLVTLILKKIGKLFSLIIFFCTCINMNSFMGS